MSTWSLDSWKRFDYQQAPDYPNQKRINQTVNSLSKMPPLVAPDEIYHLKSLIKAAGRGEAFILQGGDCAERFSDCRSEIISNKLKILLQMSVVLLYRLHRPIIRIGRIAGQYAKPRSNAFETQEGITLPAYRGDLVNRPAFTEEARTPNPNYLIEGYTHAALTLNYIRALMDGGWGDYHHPFRWDLDFVKLSPKAALYHQIVHQIADHIDGALPPLSRSLHNDFFTSHEALNLYYEQALTREISTNTWLNLSTHLPWIGMRTAYPNSAHVELLRGISNPIGLKIGNILPLEHLQSLLETLNPMREEGRILLISRFGAKSISKSLPHYIDAVSETKIPVTWVCDPMHGNTEITSSGIKTRHFDTLLEELKQAVLIHKKKGSILGGVHFELTGENVTECVGGARNLKAQDLKRAYKSLVDPRLNYEQSLEMALQLSEAMKESTRN